MQYKALINFVGIICMSKGDVQEIEDVSLAEDLLQAGYIEAVETQKSTYNNENANNSINTKAKKKTVKNG